MLADKIPIPLFDAQYANEHYISYLLVENFLTCAGKQQQNLVTKQWS